VSFYLLPLERRSVICLERERDEWSERKEEEEERERENKLSLF